MPYQIIQASAHKTGLPDESVDCIITSPPYKALRSYAGDQALLWEGVTYFPMAGVPYQVEIPGCDPTCDHLWDNLPEIIQRGKAGDKSTMEGSQNRGRQTISTQGAYCMRCGGWKGGLGEEPTLEMFIGHLILVMREMHRVLKPRGVAFFNLGESYNGSGGAGGDYNEGGSKEGQPRYRGSNIVGLKPKDMMLVPERFALAAQADGWWLRSKFPWIKRSGLPESVTDRPARFTEQVFMFTKSQTYYWDEFAVKQPVAESSRKRLAQNVAEQTGTERANGGAKTNGTLRAQGDVKAGRTLRDTDFFMKTWQGLLLDGDGLPLALVVNPKGFSAAHFATFPELIPATLLAAASSQHGVCPQCGAPWRRVTEKQAAPTRATHSRTPDGQGSHGNLSRKRNDEPHTVVTIGWQPTCTCNQEGIEYSPDDLDLIMTPTGKGGSDDDPSLVVGRAGMSRVRNDDEGRRPITRYEQRQYADQIRTSPHWAEMKAIAGSAIEHYVRKDVAGARPLPQNLLDEWLACGWLVPVIKPSFTPYDPIPATVLDPFVGSGTSVRAAIAAGRDAIGVDISADYLEEIVPERVHGVQIGMQF